MNYVFFTKWRLLRIHRKDFLTAYKSDRDKCINDFFNIMDIFCAEYSISYKFDETEMLYIAEALSRGQPHSKCYVEFTLAPVCGAIDDNPFTYIGHCLNISVKSGRNDMKTLYTYSAPFNERA